MGRLALAGAAAVAALMTPAGAAAGPVSSTDLANGCFAARSESTGQFVVAAGDGYRADGTEAQAVALYLKPSGLGTYLPHDQDGLLMSARQQPVPLLPGSDAVGRDQKAGPATEWTAPKVSKRSFSFKSTSTGRPLAVAPSGALVQGQRDAAGPETRFELVQATRCRAFPEAEVNATGTPFKGTNADGSVNGFADMHFHPTANFRAGGKVIYGDAFNPFGIPEALGHDADVHGPEGALDVTGNLLRTGSPVGTHDTHGWPTFSGWPVHDTNTHQQIYYRWLERVWRAGERLVVAQTVEDEPLCKIEPNRQYECNEAESIERQVAALRGLEAYVDAQSGGPGRGWFRLVFGPDEARQAIEHGKLAVLIGAESSGLFGCTEFMDQPQCTREDIDAGVERLHALGVSSVFPIHWTDNAFGGAALEEGDKGTFIGAMQVEQTGHPFRTGPCPEPEHGAECNSKGLTDLGEYLIRRLIAEHMLIEADHMSERARLQALAIAEQENYPLVSSHTGSGGVWSTTDLNRLYAIGGIAAARPDQADGLAGRILQLRDQSGTAFCAVGLGTDTGGFSSAPGPRDDAAQSPLNYPFRSYDGRVQFDRQRSGERTYDLNSDGVGHYGLYADLLADMRRRTGDEAIGVLFRSAEGYLDTWERAASHGVP